MLEREVLVWELGAVDASTARAILAGEVAALDHGIGNDPMKRRAFVAETFFTRAKGTEVFGCFWGHIRPQFHDNTAERSAIGGDVKKCPGQIVQDLKTFYSA